MMEAQTNPGDSTKEDSKSSLISFGPSKTSLMEFEKKLEEAESAKQTAPPLSTTVPVKNDLLARVKEAQQRAKMAQEKQKRAQMERDKALKEEERILAELKETSGGFEQVSGLENEELNQVEVKEPYLTKDEDLISSSPFSTPAAFSSETQHNTRDADFEQFEVTRHQIDDIDDVAFQLDPGGNKLTPEKSKEMILEQQKIMNQIEEEKKANDVAIAALMAEQETGNSSSNFASPFMTTEEAMLMTTDRKLAEKIQNEEYTKSRSSTAATGVISEELRALGGRTNDPTHAQKQKSWSEYLTTLMPNSGAEEEDADSKPRSAEIVVGRRSHPLQHVRRPGNAIVYGNDTEEISFENKDDEQSELLPGLVGGSKPLFSCVVESVSSILSGQNEIPDGELHGVDTSNLLTVTEASRKGKDDGRGEYVGLNTY